MLYIKPDGASKLINKLLMSLVVYISLCAPLAAEPIQDIYPAGIKRVSMVDYVGNDYFITTDKSITVNTEFSHITIHPQTSCLVSANFSRTMIYVFNGQINTVYNSYPVAAIEGQYLGISLQGLVKKPFNQSKLLTALYELSKQELDATKLH